MGLPSGRAKPRRRAVDLDGAAFLSAAVVKASPMRSRGMAWVSRREPLALGIEERDGLLELEGSPIARR